MSRISVVVPVYNRPSVIKRCLSSILNSGYENLEVLVIDDGSHDGTLEMIRESESSHPRQVRVLIHPGHVNLGVSASRNLGIDSATGDYVCFLDSDDVMLSGRFDAAVHILDTYSNVDGVYEAAEVFSQSDERIALLAPGEEVDFSSLGELDIEPVGMIHTGGILIRRSLFDRCGLFDTERWVGEDIHMWLRMFAIARLVPGSMQRPVVRYYKHAGNTSGFDVPLVELDVVADVYKWACERKVAAKKLASLRKKYMSLFYYYLAETRRERLGFRRELALLARAAMHFPQCLAEKQYLANVYRFVNRVSVVSSSNSSA